MEIPDRIAERLEGEKIQSAVNLGDEDVICFTPTRTILYRGEGLLSDESVEVFSHDVERLGISRGRRKTKFSLEYVDARKEFSVTSNRTEQVLQRLLASILEASSVIGEEESVAGVYLFSELTIVVTDTRLVKHIGSYVWDPDYEEFPYSEVTGLTFEPGSVATQIVISVGGRPQRIKAPNDEAKKLKRTLTDALFSFYEVRTLEELNEAVDDDDSDEETETEDRSNLLGLDDTITPLVSDSSASDDTDATSAGEDATASEDGADTEGTAANGGTESATAEGSDATAATESTVTTASTADGKTATEDGENNSEQTVDGGGSALITDTESGETETATDNETSESTGQQIDPEEIEAMRQQIATLTMAVEEQNEQIENQRETIEQLIEELRQHA